MPIYAYKCSACEHELDVLQKISDAPLLVCPKCGAPALAKQLTAAGFQLKGSGWYATDFKNAGAKPEAKADAKPEEKSAAKPADAAPGKSDKTVEAAPAAPATPATGGAPAAGAAAGAQGAGN